MNNEIFIKNNKEINCMRESCSIAAIVLNQMCNSVVEGMSAYELDQIGKSFIEKLGAKSACYKYKMNNIIFPNYTCISINNEVVHGIGTKNKIIKKNDIISIDVSVKYNGFAGDNAKTIVLSQDNQINQDIYNLIKTTEEALYLGIMQAKHGNKVGDISYAIQSHVEKKGLSIVKEFVGHGIGKNIHEEPTIPNFGIKNKGLCLIEGMTLAIEPIVNLGSDQVIIDNDGWTIKTKDKMPSAHFEHTILVTKNKPEILTVMKK